MEKTKDRGGLNFIVALMVIGGTILFVLVSGDCCRRGS